MARRVWFEVIARDLQGRVVARETRVEKGEAFVWFWEETRGEMMEVVEHRGGAKRVIYGGLREAARRELFAAIHENQDGRSGRRMEKSA